MKNFLRIAIFSATVALAFNAVKAEAKTVKLLLPNKTFKVVTSDGLPIPNIGLRVSIGAYDSVSHDCGGIPPTPGNPFDFIGGVMDSIGTTFGMCRRPIGILGSPYEKYPDRNSFGPLFTTNAQGFATVPYVEFISKYSEPFVEVGIAGYTFTFRASNGISYTCLNEGTIYPYDMNRIIDIEKGPQTWGDGNWQGKISQATITKNGSVITAMLNNYTETIVPQMQVATSGKDKYGEETVNYSLQPLSSSDLQKQVDSRREGVESFLKNASRTADVGYLGCEIAK